MDAEERESLARSVDAVQAALDDERARHQEGLEPEPALARLYRAHDAACSPETAHRLKADGAPAQALARRVAALAADRQAARLEEAWRAAESAAAVPGPQGPVPLAEAERSLPRERDGAVREVLARHLEAALAPAASAREAWAEARVRARAEAGLFPDWAVVVEGDQALGATDDAWADLLGWVLRRDEALAAEAPRGLQRHQLLRLLAFPALDGLFRPAALTAAVRETARDLGLPLDGLRIDEATNPGAWPGAHVTGRRLALRRSGGLADWPVVLDALGRALGNAHLPGPDQASSSGPGGRSALGPDGRSALGAALGGCLAGLCLEPRWLAPRLGVEKREAPDLVRALGLRRLLGLRAAAAALRVATEVERGLSGQAWREAHREALSAALHAAWEGVRASRDADAGTLAATLRGFAEGERLREDLRERFDEDWWRNPRAREHLAALLAAGRLPEGEPAPVTARAAGLSRALERGGAA